MLLDLSKYKKKIIEKLENKDLNFNEVEIMMLNIDSDIRKKFFDALKADLSLFTVDVLKVVKKINDYDEVLLDDLNLLLAYGKAEITVGDDYSIVYELRNYVEEESVKEVENYFLELIDTNQLKPNADSSSEVIEFVLDNKRFSFFDYVGKCGKFSATVINKIKEYADTVERVPDFFAEEQESLNLDYSKYSAAALLKIFGQKVYGKDNNYLNVVNKGEDEDIDKIYRLICDKLSIGESFDIKLFQKNLIPQFINFDQNNKRNLLTKIIEVIGIDESLINSLGDDFSSYEDLLLNSISPQTEIKAISNVFSDIFRSTKILEKLIECGLLEFATNFQRFADYTSVVINKIESGDPLYQNISINHNYAIQRDLNLLSILLEKNMITNLSFSANELISSSSLKKIVLEAVRRGQTIRFDENCYELDGVLDTIIQSRNFETLRQTNLNQLDNAILKEESINILIEELKQNVVLVDKILLSANSLIFQNKSLLNFYLQSDEYFI